jgi:acetolactate synthase-1/2/3 large subunit
LIEFCARLFARGKVGMWLGFGARDAAQDILALAELTGAVVWCTPRAKGVFPETHPLYVGVTGIGGGSIVSDFVRGFRPDTIVVLGSRLEEASSFWNTDLIHAQTVVQVDIDPLAHGAAYPEAPIIGVKSDIGMFVRSIRALLPKSSTDSPTVATRLEKDWAQRLQWHGDESMSEGVRPQVLMRAVQDVIVDGSTAIILAESGNCFAWATSALRFSSPGRYRLSTGFGAMGHAATGVLGAAYASASKALALVGDGAMLMNNEISTAVQYQIDAVWVILNDSGYGMVRQGMSKLGFTTAQLDFPVTNFSRIAQAMGAGACRVKVESELRPALQEAMNTPGPFVVDVVTDRNCVAPFGGRVDSILTERQKA